MPPPSHPGEAQLRGMAGECRSAEDRSVQARRRDRSCGMGRGAHLPMGAAVSTSAANPSADASAQRHRGLEGDAQDGVAWCRPPVR